MELGYIVKNSVGTQKGLKCDGKPRNYGREVDQPEMALRADVVVSVLGLPGK